MSITAPIRDGLVHGSAWIDAYQDSIPGSGLPAGSPEEALDCACGLYLNDPTAWAGRSAGELVRSTTTDE
ncbi:hypothetical protein ACFQZ4_42340 [Catellatospora coxensis]|uniref:Uncharacterized protein n=1 Tax=Catellatospora coxensis TaxID=310354 RepID=A0A8J3PC74_9ACTN|nr:hypothetical protein [Catellatospora coxensis]GIG11088.1 hypothetical protein Cco03nite_77880 [Catellatospora coxensis]